MKKLFLYSIFALFFFVSCDDSDHSEISEGSRTVIFYMVGDNSLSRFIDVNLAELQAGLTEKGLNNGHLVLYIDDKEKNPRIIELKVNNTVITKEIVRTYEEQDSTDPDVMREVIRDIQNNFHTNNYGLVLWSHATAWLPKNADRLISTRTFGDDYGKKMNIDALADALSSFHFDFILFDACYMGSIEVAYELRKVTDYLIASPMEVWAEGFPYKLIVNKFFKMPDADLIGISSDFYNYYDAQSGVYRAASVVLADMNKMDKIASVMQSIMKKYKSDLAKVKLKEIQATEHLFFGKETSVLYDLDNYIKELTRSNNEISNNDDYIAMKDALNEAIIYRAYTPFSYFSVPNRSYEIKNYSGFSIYPLGFHPQLDRWYERLEWYKAVYE